MTQLSIAIILGLIPSIIWLLFYLRKDQRPEPNRIVILVFILGMIVTLPAALVEMGFKNFINPISETYPLTLSGLLEKKLFL